MCLTHVDFLLLTLTVLVSIRVVLTVIPTIILLLVVVISALAVLCSSILIILDLLSLPFLYALQARI